MAVVPLTDLLTRQQEPVPDPHPVGSTEGGTALELPTVSALRRYVLSADVVYDGLGTPRADAGVVIQSHGASANLVKVGAVEQLNAEFPDASTTAAGFAITPTVVNAHTHLDLSDMPFTPGAYVDFIRAVIGYGIAEKRGVDAARNGVAELVAAGTKVIGDIVAREEVMHYLLDQDEVGGVAYWEVIGPDPERADLEFEQVKRVVNAFRQSQRPGGMRVGLSPHAPHTVSAKLMYLVTRWAKTEGLPVAIHVGESPAETRLHRHGDGPLAESLRLAAIPFESRGVSPVAYLDQLGVLATSPTLVHMVEVDEDDVRTVQHHGCTVVHCPRSNEALECGRFPWELYARHGVEVAFGTDSLGSSPDLDVTAEVMSASRLHGAKANVRAMVRALVKGGHKALGLNPPRVTRGGSAADLYAWGNSTGVSSELHG